MQTAIYKKTESGRVCRCTDDLFISISDSQIHCTERLMQEQKWDYLMIDILGDYPLQSDATEFSLALQVVIAHEQKILKEVEQEILKEE